MLVIFPKLADRQNKLIMNNHYKIILMNPGHFDDVVAVHLKAFLGFTLNHLGERFINGLFTDIEDHQDLIGFVVGSA